MKRIPADKVKATIGRHMLADGYDMTLDLKNSKGSWIRDAITGRTISIFSASLPVLPWGSITPP